MSSELHYLIASDLAGLMVSVDGQKLKSNGHKTREPHPACVGKML